MVFKDITQTRSGNVKGWCTDAVGIADDISIDETIDRMEEVMTYGNNVPVT
jgi:hypothetical protein